MSFSPISPGKKQSPNNKNLPGMEIIPAIDLKDGQCVRLLQGRMEQATVYGSDPAAMARRWQEAGASCLHVVDLDAAVRQRAAANVKAVAAICASVNMKIELGGGLRGEEDIQAAFDLGVQRVVLGTLALKDPPQALALARTYPGRILIGLDSRGGKVAGAGWLETSEIEHLALAKLFDQPWVAGLIFTDIARDGMHSGPNLAAVKELCQTVKTPVIASGGVHDIADIKNLLALEPLGLRGVITGRAIYDGSLDLAQAVAWAQTAGNKQ
jgi:phosphoribosylformimino-5-aminoimidazole carboxamide ribotide isomerase